ncbi:conserved Plasmodium protein, unknown function [Plasmodium knowlesi strain H]|uniref:Uncharacterized protein n=3 Tax=Plasmodium knowlesi TaxID=5850 RepID=A0A5K1VSD6_PLAKH|nr:conserved Plasmodium protein, unknown function [Plasmodium knowlesi strain H]OTN66328.1 Uncharacterized protein PKNOH_S09542400 [Plasmodium knowlesi]CAA9989889.1 conserved Plasmodium protein, unknown function [Plasmodium knowlesi strain H]SBO24451.1 conserved Plasmodium protein, unknown function [Plasmodium knowlesi strain H]SBO26547.1 conserved Plasmodium protein, unknown function [Plasmodium knowlesi strain H]VVS79363.1 conserved Plasmodium protein, unknown function [Plasmodium knowlesi s|eukprot:XP_002259905.1 hypothetical protein, conserved in Plasmodium species [Plasmodium knowlesi strain H]
MALQKSERFHEMYHGNVCDVQIGDVDTRKGVGRVGRSCESNSILPPEMDCIYSCICNDLRGDHCGNNSSEGKENLSILRIGKEVKKDSMRNTYTMKSADFAKENNRRCKKVTSDKGSPCVHEDSSERIRFSDVRLHACTIAECRDARSSREPEEYLHDGCIIRKGMRVATHENNSLTNEQRKGSSSSFRGGSAILKHLRKGKKKKKKKKKRKRKEESMGNIILPVGEASKMAKYLYRKNVHRGNDKNLNNDNEVLPATRKEKNENIIELSKGKRIDNLEGAFRTMTHGKENSPKMKPILRCKSGKKVFRSHLELHRLKCRTMKIIEKLKDAMIKENIAYNKKRMSCNGGYDNGSSLSIKGKEVDRHDKDDNGKGDLDNYCSNGNGNRVGRGVFAKRTRGTFLKEEDYLVYKFRRTLRKYVKKYLHRKLIILENFHQAERNIANERMIHTFVIPSLSDRVHKKVSNYCSYVDKYVRKFFQSYFVMLVNQFFNYYFFHNKRKCVKNYVGSFGARGGKLDGEAVCYHQPFCSARFSTINDNVSYNRLMYSSSLDMSKKNFAPSSGRENTSKGITRMSEGRSSLRVFSLPTVNRSANEGFVNSGKDLYFSYISNCCNGESSFLDPAEGCNLRGSFLNWLDVEHFKKEKDFGISGNPKRRNFPCVDLKLGAGNDARERGNRGGEKTQGRVCSSNDACGNGGHTGSEHGNGNSGGSGSGNSSGNCRDGHSGNRSGSGGSKENGGSSENGGNSEDNNGDNNDDHTDGYNDDSGNDSSNESSNDNAKGKDAKGKNREGNIQSDDPKEKSGVNTQDKEHENYYKLIREIEFLENNENAKESTSVKEKDLMGADPGKDEQKVTSTGVNNGQLKLDSGTMEKEEDASMDLEPSGEDNQLLNINQMIIHTTNYVGQPLKLPLLPEMSHPNSYSSLSPRNNTCGSSSSSSSSGSSGSSSSSGNSSTSSSGNCSNQGGGKNNINQVNDPDFEEACDIRLMNTPENMKFSQSPPTSSLHASSLHLTDVNELVLSPNQQIYSNSPLKSPGSTPLTPASPIFDSNYNEENMEKVNSNYFVSSPYKNDIFSEFDMLGSFFESLDELENKSDYTESSSNENSKFSQDFSLDMCGPKKGKKGNIEKDEVIYNFKRDNYKKVFHAWCNKGKHELNYDNKKFNSIMEWINYIEELMSHEGQNDNKDDGDEERQPHQGQQMEVDMAERLEEEHCDLLHEMEHELEHEREQEDIMNIGMNANFFSEENVYQVSNSAFRSDEYMSVGKENEGGSGEVDYGASGQVDYSVNSGVDYLVSTGVDYMVSSMAEYAVNSGGADSDNDQGEYYKDSGERSPLKEENNCDNFLASQNVNVMMSAPQECSNSFVADNLNAYQADETGRGALGMSNQHSHCAIPSSTLIKPNYDANPCISNFGGEQNLLSEYNNAEDNITYCNNDSRGEALGDYFLPSTLEGAQIENGSCGVGSSGFMWKNGSSGVEGNCSGSMTENLANPADNHEGNHEPHVPQLVGTENTFLGLGDAEKVGAQNEKDTGDNCTPSSNCADIPDPWMAQ